MKAKLEFDLDFIHEASEFQNCMKAEEMHDYINEFDGYLLTRQSSSATLDVIKEVNLIRVEFRKLMSEFLT